MQLRCNNDGVGYRASKCELVHLDQQTRSATNKLRTHAALLHRRASGCRDAHAAILQLRRRDRVRLSSSSSAAATRLQEGVRRKPLHRGVLQRRARLVGVLVDARDECLE